MLILSRRIGESIAISDNIVVTILGQASPGQIRVGIEAPRDIPVHRMEVKEKIDAKKIETKE